MDDRIQAIAIEAARELLQSFKLEHPGWTDDKTPVDSIVSWLGLEVATFHPNDYAEGTYGWLEPEEDLIWLCRDLPETLRRFTLAHELGHVILHRHTGHQAPNPSTTLNTGIPLSAEQPVPDLTSEDPCQAPDVREEVIGPVDSERAEDLLGIGQSYNPRSQRELAANIFAAELLMPLTRVRTLYLQEGVSPRKFASLFDVSTAAMLNRLAGLLEEPISQPLPLSQNPVPAPKKHYDKFQQAAIEAPTPALIVAGPGSGKTSTLIGRVEYLIHTQNVEPQHILALTFSRKAAQEMRDRLQHALHPGIDQVKADTNLSIPTVSTFHAFCAELLRRYGSLVGLRPDFAFVEEADGYFLLRRLAKELPLRHYQNLSAPAFYFPAILSAISRAKDELVTPAQYRQMAQRMLDSARDDEEQEKAEKAREIAEIYTLYEAALQHQGDTDFGGLIMLAVQLLQQHPEVRVELQQQYRHILVDEFQDINRASGVLLRLLAGEPKCVWVVGDANQAIYSFRGASPANIANFRDDYPDAVVLPLSRNYRSRPDIVSLADTFREKQLEPDREAVKSSTARPTLSNPYITLAVATDEASELNGLLADIRDKHAQGYSYRDIVILCRTRAQARKITRALALANLPVIERGGVLEQEHIKDVLSILLLSTDTGSKGLLRAARQSEHPLSQDDIEALLLAAREQKCSPLQLINRNEVPLTLSAIGRRSITRLSNILQGLQRAPNVWSLLAQYLFIETSLARNLLYDADTTETTETTETFETFETLDTTVTRATSVLVDYASLLSLARYYDQGQQALRTQREQEAGEQEADTSTPQVTQPIPPINEQIKDFLDYLNVLVTLRQDGGNRSEGTEGSGEELPDVIRVMTVHASKGLEFPVVYLPGLVQRRFPMQKRSSPVSPPTGMLSAENGGDAVHESGEACLFYVGATRARDHLVLSYSERYGKQKYSRSPYIDALVVGLSEERISRVLWHDNVGTTPLEQVVNDALPSSQPSPGFIDAMKPQSLSASAIESYATCPRRYAYSYIYGFEAEKGAYQLFWQATQKTFEALQTMLSDMKGTEAEAKGTQISDTPSQAGFPTRLEAQDLYIQHWSAMGGNELPFASIYEKHGREVIDLLWNRLAGSKDTKWELRQGFNVEIAGKTVRVDVDRVETPTQVGTSEPAKFVRTHYGKRKDKPTASTREMLYTRAYRQLHPGHNIELHAHNMSTGETFEIKLTEKREQKLYDELEQLILALERDEFPPKPDPFICPTCPFVLICPA